MWNRKSLSTDSLAKSHKCIQSSAQWGTNIPAQPLLWGSPFVAIFVSLFSGFNILVPFSTFVQFIVPSFWIPDKIWPVIQRQKEVLIQQLNWFGDTTQLLDNCTTSMKQTQEGKGRNTFYCQGNENAQKLSQKNAKTTRLHPLKISKAWSSESPDSPADPLAGPTEWNKPHF